MELYGIDVMVKTAEPNTALPIHGLPWLPHRWCSLKDLIVQYSLDCIFPVGVEIEKSISMLVT